MEVKGIKVNKKNKKQEVRSWFVCLPDVNGINNWEEIEAKTALESAEIAVREAIRDYSELNMHGLGDHPKVIAQVKKSENARAIYTFEVLGDIDITWEAWKA